MSHLVYSTLGPGETSSLASPGPIPPFRADKENGVSAGRQTVPQVAAEIPSQPPPVSEYGVVGSDPAAVQFISLCLDYLHSRPETSSNILEVWRENLNEFTMKSAVEVSSQVIQRLTSPFLKTKLIGRNVGGIQ